jgi:hypothetical protein
MTSLWRVDYGTATTRWPVVVGMSVSNALLLMPLFGLGRRALFEISYDRRIIRAVCGDVLSHGFY